MKQKNYAHLAVLDNRSESIRYDFADYPVYVRTGPLSLFEDYTAEAHWHPDIELIYIISGKMSYNINGDIVSMSEGEGIFVNARQIHYGFSNHTECEFLCIVFDPVILAVSPSVQKNMVEPILSDPQLPYIYLQPSISWHKDILNILKTIRPNDSVSAVLSYQSAFLSIWKCIYDNVASYSKEVIVGNENISLMQKMLGYIHTNYADPLTLKGIADAADISVSKACQMFSRYLHTTPMSFVAQYRIKTAAQLLRSTEYPITEVAMMTGFSSVSYFGEIFHKYMGTSPRSYRKEITVS